MVTDIYGQEIKEGDWIAYPGRSGSRLWINTSRVVSVGVSRRTLWGVKGEYDILKVINTRSKTKKISTVTCLENVIKMGPEAVAWAKDRGIIKEE